MAIKDQFTNESFIYNGSTINPNDNLTTPGKINYSATFKAGNGTPSKQDLELTLPADLFRPAITLTINPISKSIPVNQPINVTFTCSDPSVNFLVGFINLENNQRNLITPPQKGSSGFQFTPKIITSKCVIEMYARDASSRVLAIARSNEFGITPPLPSQPPNVSLSIEQVNDFSAGEYRKIKFNYTGPRPHHFDLGFYDSQNKTNISGQLVSSSTDFDFTAPVIASNNCMFVITAIAADGSQIIQSPSNPFQILPGISVIIEPIYNAVPINSNLVVKFKYTGPKLSSSFQVGILNKGKNNPSTPLVSVSVSPNSNNDYTVTIKVPNNKNLVSNDCYVLVNVLVANKRTNFYSNQFKIVSTPILPELSINLISDLPLNTTNKITFTFNGNAHYFRAFFSSDNGSNYNQLPKLINRNYREFDFNANIPGEKCLIGLVAYDSSNNEIAKTISNDFKISNEPLVRVSKNPENPQLPTNPTIIQIINITNINFPPELIQLLKTLNDYIKQIIPILGSINSEFISLLNQLNTSILELIHLLNEGNLDGANQTIININQLLIQIINLINGSNLSKTKKQQYISVFVNIISQINIIINASNKNKKPSSRVRNPYFEVRVGGQTQNSDETDRVKLNLDLTSTERGSIFIKNLGPSGNLSWNAKLSAFTSDGISLLPLVILNKNSGTIKVNREDLFEVKINHEELMKAAQGRKLEGKIYLYLKGGRVPGGLFRLFAGKKSSRIIIPIMIQ